MDSGLTRAYLRRGVLGVLVILASAAPLSAERDEVEKQAIDPPTRVFFKISDEQPLRGTMFSWDEQGFDYRDAEGEAHRASWTDIGVRDQFYVQQRLIDGRSADQWLRLGARLLPQEGGKPYADQAFKRAERLKPELASVIKQLRDGADLAGIDEPTDGEAEPTPDKSQDMHAQGSGGPRVVGQVDDRAWPEQTPEQRAAAIERLKAVGERASKEVTRVALLETEYFLFYTNMGADEAKRWAGLLDKMYHRLCELFDLPEGENIWSGKCLILVFRDKEDFQQFEKQVHRNNMPDWAAGLCTQYGSGDVHVSFYRQPNAHRFADILVHETVHGFLHRYRTGHRVPSWANEGLAEYIAAELVPRATSPRYRYDKAKELLGEGGHKAFFENRHIQPAQYHLAYIITAYMIAQNKTGYVDFIRAVKGGMPWPEALTEKFGAGHEKILYVLSRQLGVKNFRP